MSTFRLLFVVALVTAWANSLANTPARDLPNLNLRISGRVTHVALQADGKLIVAGDYSEIDDTEASTLSRLNADGSLDTSWLPSASTSISALAISDDGNLYAGYWAGGLVKIPTAGSGERDPNFHFLDNWDAAESIVVEGDYLYTAIAGELRRYSTATGNRDVAWGGSGHDGHLLSDHAGHLYSGIVRINIADGSVDTTWTPPTIVSEIRATALSADGYLYVATTGDIGGVTEGVARLSIAAHGAIDTAWHPVAPGDSQNFRYDALLPASDGSLFIAGKFQNIGGLNRENLARITASGAADPNWTADTDGEVEGLATVPAGAVIASGTFTKTGDALRASLAYLNSNGMADASHTTGFYAPATVRTVVPDATHWRIYVGGRFDWVGNERHRNVLRLDATGMLDSAWTPWTDAPPGAYWEYAGVHTILVAPPYVYVGGVFTTLNGIPRRALGRVGEASPGAVDANWDPGVTGSYQVADDSNSSVDALLLDRQGRLTVGGDFYGIGGVEQSVLARFGTNGAIDAGWQPQAYFPVIRLTYDGADSFYAITIGTAFSFNALHKVSATTGALDSAWEQAASMPFAYDLVIADSNSLLVSGQVVPPNARIVRISRQSGTMDQDWSPPTSCTPFRLALDGPYLYAGGFDTSSNGVDGCLQRIDINGSIDASFAPAWTDFSEITAIASSGGAIYAGGIFESVSGSARRALVAFDATDAVFANGFEE